MELGLSATSPLETEDEGTARVSVCPLCLEEPVKYTCPRCNTPYCSVKCYQSSKHVDCSEMFYKDCFMEGLKDSDIDPKDKQNVMEMLARAEAEPGPDDLNLPENDLHERLGDLDLDRDSKKVWARLTEQEKREFEQMVGDGRLGNLVELWSPWWSSQPRIVEMEDQTSSIEQLSNEKCSIRTSKKPNIRSSIPNISQILKSKPSACVKYNIVNLLYAYAYVCRLHNGDHVTMATQSAHDLFTISLVLRDGQNCESVGDAIHSCLGCVRSLDVSHSSSQQFNVDIIKDVEQLVTPSTMDVPLENVLCALSEVFVLFKKAHSSASKEIKRRKRPQNNTVRELEEDKGKMFHCMKKCEFFLSWVQTYGMALVGLVPELHIEYSRLSSDLASIQKDSNELEAQWANKGKQERKLIQEL